MTQEIHSQDFNLDCMPVFPSTQLDGAQSPSSDSSEWPSRPQSAEPRPSITNRGHQRSSSAPNFNLASDPRIWRVIQPGMPDLEFVGDPGPSSSNQAGPSSAPGTSNFEYAGDPGPSSSNQAGSSSYNSIYRMVGARETSSHHLNCIFFS